MISNSKKSLCNMRLMVVACLVAALAVTVSGDCDACIDGLCYKKQLLPDAAGKPAAVDRNINTLYVIGTDRKLIKKCNLDTVTCKSSPNSLDIYAIAVDQRSGDIYGSVYHGTGIYKLDLVNNEKVMLDSTANVWRMAFMDKIYFSSTLAVYTFEGGRSQMVAGTEDFNVLYFIVDNKQKMYVYDATTSNIYSRKLSGRDVGWSVLQDNIFRWTIDKDGNAMFFQLNTNIVYRVTDDRSVEVGVVNETNFCHDHIFDKYNNLIYTVEDQRYILRKNNARCTTSVVENKRTITETVVPTTVAPVKWEFTTDLHSQNDQIDTHRSLRHRPASLV